MTSCYWPVPTGRYYRLNIVIKAATAGGKFFCSQPIYTSRRIKFSRSDLAEHSVSPVITGSRYVLSIGWIRQ